jgi:4'-phosphopantetheinyl transferase
MTGAGARPRETLALVGEPELALRAEGAEVWRLDLAHARPPEPGELSPAEEERVRRRAFEEDRRRFAASRAALRRLLAARTGTTPSALRIEEGPHGRPEVAGGPRFSLSHSGPLWVCALTEGREVGVDVEALREVPEAAQIAARWFGPGERAVLAAAPEARRREAFLRGWVRKEAYLKALGVGFASDETARLEPDPSSWAVVDLDPSPGFVGALVVRIT